MERAQDGHPCYVVDVVGLGDVRDSQYNADVRVWLDAGRDLRPLKFEKYEWQGGAPDEARWKRLQLRIDGIRLEYIDGIWFPVEGKQAYFRLKGIERPKSMNRIAFWRLTKTEQLRVGAPVLEEVTNLIRHTKVGIVIVWGGFRVLRQRSR